MNSVEKFWTCRKTDTRGFGPLRVRTIPSVTVNPWNEGAGFIYRRGPGSWAPLAKVQSVEELMSIPSGWTGEEHKGLVLASGPVWVTAGT